MISKLETLVNESPVTVNELVNTAMARAKCIGESAGYNVAGNFWKKQIAIELLKLAIEQLDD